MPDGRERLVIHAIVLAAGRSRRMGAQKLLLPFAGSTVIGHIVGQIAASDACGVHVVVGADGAAVAEALRGHPIRTVTNPMPESEMLDSVRCGLRAVPPECDAVLVVLGDQPGITPALVNRQIAAFAGSCKGIIVPVLNGRRGHPLLLSMAYRESVLRDHDSVGIRGLLRDHPMDVLELPVSEDEWASDMDYPEDYARELRRRI